jgi:hypothetical protein
MAQRTITPRSRGTALFPEYATLYDLIAREVEGLTDAQLDWKSDKWEWSKWSIRTQLSHMASLIYRWLLVRWGDTLFPTGEHGVEDLKSIAQSEFDRRMDDNQYWELPAIMKKLKEGIALAQRVLATHNVGFLRTHTVTHQRSPQWVLMYKAHPTGIEPAAPVDVGTMTLEATMRHIYFEETTHLYNIQRLKKAQGLPAVVEVPRVGYWVLDGWDRSEP